MNTNDDHYRLIGIYVLVVLALLTWFFRSCVGCGGDVPVVTTSSRTDTVIVEFHDTVPVERERLVVRYVRIAVPSPSAEEQPVVSQEDSIPAVTLPVVRKTFSDDSTYTAYVSGVEYDGLPTLDSIVVRQRTVVRTVVNTVTVEQRPCRLGVGLVGGYGYGFSSRRMEPFVGIGLSYRL